MSDQEYTPHEALYLILEKVTQASPVFGNRISDAINIGKEKEVPVNKYSTKTFRKHLPYTDEEAIQVALDVLESHLVETRAFIIETHKEFMELGYVFPALTQASQDSEDIFEVVPTHGHEVMLITTGEEIHGVGEPKRLEIEIETETVQSQQGVENFPLEAVEESDLHEIGQLIHIIRRLTDFSGGSNADSQ